MRWNTDRTVQANASESQRIILTQQRLEHALVVGLSLSLSLPLVLLALLHLRNATTHTPPVGAPASVAHHTLDQAAIDLFLSRIDRIRGAETIPELELLREAKVAAHFAGEYQLAFYTALTELQRRQYQELLLELSENWSLEAVHQFDASRVPEPYRELFSYHQHRWRKRIAKLEFADAKRSISCANNLSELSAVVDPGLPPIQKAALERLLQERRAFLELAFLDQQRKKITTAKTRECLDKIAETISGADLQSGTRGQELLNEIKGRWGELYHTTDWERFLAFQYQIKNARSVQQLKLPERGELPQPLAMRLHGAAFQKTRALDFPSTPPAVNSPQPLLVNQEHSRVENVLSSEATSLAPIYGEDTLYFDRIDAALRWLADHQHENGNWNPESYQEDSARIAEWGRYEEGGSVHQTEIIDFVDESIEPENRVNEDCERGAAEVSLGVTALACLSLLRAGHLHTNRSAYADNVKSGLRWLVRQQTADGFFGNASSQIHGIEYGHAFAVMALAEAYKLSDDERLLHALRDGVDWILRAQNTRIDGGGWRYGIRSRDNDSSLTVKMVQALKAAEDAGIYFDTRRVYENANMYFDEMLAVGRSGYLVTGYKYPGLGSARLPQCQSYSRTPSMDAANLLTRQLTQAHVINNLREQSHLAGLIQRNHKSWYSLDDESYGPWGIDMYFWLYGTMAMARSDADQWQRWQESFFEPVLLRHQRAWHPKDQERFGPEIVNEVHRLDEHGSWDSVGAWGLMGGRIYSTAFCTLMLCEARDAPRLHGCIEMWPKSR